MPTEKRKKIKSGIILMTLGLLFISAAGGLFAFNRIIDNKAGETADRIYESVMENTDEESYRINSNSERVAVIDGVEYIGIISIPSYNIVLPVQSDWSLDKLRNSPCRYSGSVTGGSLIICAHNYQSHFGKLKYIQVGDKIRFTDMMGMTYTYSVSEIDLINGYNVEEMKENNGWDLTLFTCNYGGRQRITLRCVRTDVNSMDKK